MKQFKERMIDRYSEENIAKYLEEGMKIIVKEKNFIYKFSSHRHGQYKNPEIYVYAHKKQDHQKEILLIRRFSAAENAHKTTEASKIFERFS